MLNIKFTFQLVCIIIFSRNYVFAQNWSLESKPIKGNGIRIPAYREKNKESSKNVFGARSNSSFAQLNTNGYIFGGEGINEMGKVTKLNDLWKINLENNTMTWITGQGESMRYISNNKMCAKSDSNIQFPSYRSGAVSFIRNNKFYVIGGEGLDSLNRKVYLNDIWIFDLNRNIWYELEFQNVKSTTPSGRKNCQYWLTDNKLYLLGGIGYSKKGRITAISDFWVFDFVTEKWTLLQDDFSDEHCTGRILKNRNNIPLVFEGGICFVMNDKLKLIGGLKYGKNGTYEMNDKIWEYDTYRNLWITNDIGNLSNDLVKYYTPQARTGSTYWRHFNDLYVYGGYSFNDAKEYKYTDDLWKLNLENYTWQNLTNMDFVSEDKMASFQGVSVIDSLNSPGSRMNAMPFSSSKQLIMIGGWSKAKNAFNYTDEIWNYHIPIPIKDTQNTVVTSTTGSSSNTNSSSSPQENLQKSYSDEVPFDFVIFNSQGITNVIDLEVLRAQGKATVSIIDIQGNIMKNEEIMIATWKERIQINIDNLVAGDYIIQLQFKGKIKNARFKKI